MRTKLSQYSSGLIVILVLVAITVVSVAKEKNCQKYIKANIYYIPWDLLNRSRLNINDVRNSYRIKININDAHETMMFVCWLNLDILKPSKDSTLTIYENNPRLVIDLYNDSGQRETYFASKNNLVSSDGGFIRPIDDDFKKRFHF